MIGEELHAPWAGEFIQRDENNYDRWANSEGILSQFTYNVVNEFYITFQALNPFGKNEEIRSVAGYGINRNEIVYAGTNTISSLAPIGGGGVYTSSVAKYLKFKYEAIHLEKGFVNFTVNVRDTKTLKQIRFERHSFNSKVGTRIHTTHINYGINGEWHLFLNFSKKRKIVLPKKTKFK